MFAEEYCIDYELGVFMSFQTSVQVLPVARESFVELSCSEQQKVIDHMGLIKSVVRKIMSHMPQHIHEEDLAHYGVLGLIDAVKKFKWETQTDSEFKIYSRFRIRGQVIDNLRRQDNISRSIREKMKTYKNSCNKLKNTLNREPTEKEVCAEAQLDFEDYQKVKIKIEQGKSVPLEVQFENGERRDVVSIQSDSHLSTWNPEALSSKNRLKELLGDAVAVLAERQKKVICLRFIEGFSVKEVAKTLMVSEPRVSQIQNRALEKLKEIIFDKMGNDFVIENFLSE